MLCPWDALKTKATPTLCMVYAQSRFAALVLVHSRVLPVYPLMYDIILAEYALS